MKKIVLTFGIISGLIVGSSFFIFSPSDGNFDFENGHIYGYITMIIAFSTIFFAVKQYRDKYNGGAVKFVKALQIGVCITFVAAVIYVFAWEIYYQNYASDFTDQYVSYMETKLANEGMDEAAIKAELAPQLEMMEKYKTNTPFRLGLTFLEILPVGFIISLISALIFGVFLKKKDAEIVVV